MKSTLFCLLAFFCGHLPFAFAQSGEASRKQPDFASFTGRYQVRVQPSQCLVVYAEDHRLMLEIVGQGKIGLTLLSANRFSVQHVKPAAIIEFIKDSLGDHFEKFSWIQKEPAQEWTRIRAMPGSLPYEGVYQLKNNPYVTVAIGDSGRQLMLRQPGEELWHVLQPLSSASYVFKLDRYKVMYTFQKDGQGAYSKLITTRSGALECVRMPAGSDSPSVYRQNFTDRSRFNQADSLRGRLTPLRSCYDVLFYDLDIRVLPETKSIQGSTVIRYKALQDFEKLQIDLFSNMTIGRILYRGQELRYTRAFNAVFVQFPGLVKKGSEEEIRVFYSGRPVAPDMSMLSGGIFWAQDRENNYWIETVSQGVGASCWWPCKDHLSDKPDSMKIHVTIPTGLLEISNGRLLAQTDLPDGLTRFDWCVSYPINSYDVAITIGKYVHWTDSYVREGNVSGREDAAMAGEGKRADVAMIGTAFTPGEGKPAGAARTGVDAGTGDTLRLNYYCLPYNRAIAEKLFKHVKPMLALYEKEFGRYPFSKDGYTIMEAIYPMEHQSAVSMGPINNPINSDKADTADLMRGIWHESAHEWWGNSVSCSDNADMWIHEAFATYAQVLDYEVFYGREAALQYLKSEAPDNKEPVIGTYDVNDFHMGDMYTKGALLLHTLRSTLANDSLWFGWLRGIQEKYRYQTINSDMIIHSFNATVGKDYTPVFDQYLRHPAIPELLLKFRQEGTGLQVQYKWKTDVAGFNLPVKVTKSAGVFSFVYPGEDWQLLSLPGMSRKDFAVNTDDCYVKVTIVAEK